MKYLLIPIFLFLWLYGCSPQTLWPQGDPINSENPQVSKTIRSLNNELTALRETVSVLNKRIANMGTQTQQIDAIEQEEAFITIKFGRTPPNYLGQLKTAVAQAVSTKNNINFLIKAVATISATTPDKKSADTRARELAWVIKQDMLSFGINPDFIVTEAVIDPIIRQDEVRIYIR